MPSRSTPPCGRPSEFDVDEPRASMAVKNLVGYRVVVTTVVLACIACWLATRSLTMSEPNPTGVQLEPLLASCVSDVLGIAALIVGLIYGNRLAFELYNERTPEANGSDANAVRPDTRF
jgi:hypothetical protein